MYNAGQLRQRIALQRPVERGVDAAGNRVIEWQTAHTVDAAARDVSGREYMEAAARQAEGIVTLTMRYRAELTEDWRVLWGGVPWNIVHINHLGYRGIWMNIKIKRVAHGGELSGGTGH